MPSSMAIPGGLAMTTPRTCWKPFPPGAGPRRVLVALDIHRGEGLSLSWPKTWLTVGADLSVIFRHARPGYDRALGFAGLAGLDALPEAGYA